MLADRIAARFGTDRYAIYLALLLAVFVAFHLTRNVFLGVQIDEANWWLQTNHLAAGYFFHPPFIVLELFAITRVLGSSPITLRLGSILFNCGSVIIIYLLTCELFKSKRMALLAAAIFMVTPLTGYWLMLGHQDAPFVFFMLLTVFLLWRGASRESSRYWYAAGVSAGLMTLCNLRAFLLFPGVLLFLLSSRETRKWLVRKEPYISLGLVGLIFLPTFLWYASRGFEPIIYQVFKRPGFLHSGIKTYLASILKHTGWEIIGVSPFVYVFTMAGLLAGLYLGLVKKDTRFALLACVSGMFILPFALTGGTPYWAFPGHVVALVAAVGVLSLLVPSLSRTRLEKFYRPVLVMLLLITPLLMSMGILYHYSSSSIMHNGWQELARKVTDVAGVDASEPGTQKPYVAGAYYAIPSEIAYFEKDKFAGFTVAFDIYLEAWLGTDSSYDPWVRLDSLEGKDMIFVDEKTNPDGFETPVSYWTEKLKPYFASIDSQTVFDVKKNDKTFRTFYIFNCHGFKGPDSQMGRKDDARLYCERHQIPQAK